ncbi:glycosyltransferase family 4 protein [Daejeonella lutea]|uniref:Glycosyltransferase involved in cell wall bisynthesis n=1 Tax=Daejeonella lutea TaxID=572036 RepID=A0A1T5FAV4_9SPHI|nr:glycosyltransferase family 4 protein [Daejeonella lutea]SKB93274.1 Glycosyltransferase involved in cell wall bisynthesis [Daejeonella lutea]
MRILLLHQYFLEENDGGGSRWNEMARMWSEKGHEVTVVAGMMHANSLTKKSEYKGKYFVKKSLGPVTVWRSHVSESYNSGFLGRLWGYFSFVFSSIWALFFKVEGKFDCILVTSPPLFISISAMLYSAIKKVPMIFEVRDLWPESAIDTGVVSNRTIIKAAYSLERLSYERATLINVLTPAFKDSLINKKNVSPKKIVFIPNAADFSLSEELLADFDIHNFRRNLGFEEKFVITYVGAHGIANKLEQILDTAKLLKDLPVVFQLIGDGMEKSKLMEVARNENIQNVVFRDPVSKKDVFKYILASDMGTSVLKKADTFKTVYSNKTFDYFSCKKPILMAIDGVSRDLVNDAEAGTFIEPENPQDFAKNVVLYINDPARLRREGDNGYLFAKKNFDRRVLSERYLTAIQNSIKGV